MSDNYERGFTLEFTRHPAVALTDVKGFLVRASDAEGHDKVLLYSQPGPRIVGNTKVQLFADEMSAAVGSADC